MSNRGPTVPLVNTGEEKAAAAQANQIEHGTETRPVIQTDSLATSSIIYSALKGVTDGVVGDELKSLQNMQRVAQRLSQNSLAPWYKGAVLLVGMPTEIADVYGAPFCTKNCCIDPTATGWGADNKDMLPWLTEIRRTYGNNWEGCMQVSAFVEQYQAAKIRDQQWAAIPAVSKLDRQNGSVRGWTSIHTAGDANIWG